MGAVLSAFMDQVLLLGPKKGLVAISTRPAVACAGEATAPVVVILNSGIIHRVGANRMHVLLARRLAAAGITSVRFDLSGIGDSERRADSLSPIESALADIREAIDSLEPKLQSRQFVLVGLCSGADHAVFYAGTDERIVGTVLLDPTIPRTRRYWLHHYAGRVLRARSWINVLSGRHPMWRKLRDTPKPAVEALPMQSGAPDIDDEVSRLYLQSKYRASMLGGRRMLAVFTGGREVRHSYRTQLLDVFPEVPFGTNLQLEYFSKAGHTFDSEASQQQVIALIEQWFAQTLRPALVSRS